MWIIKKEATYQITSVNLHEKNGKFQVWIERPAGNNIKIFESDNQAEAQEVKDAIDYALTNKIPTLTL